MRALLPGLSTRGLGRQERRRGDRRRDDRSDRRGVSIAKAKAQSSRGILLVGCGKMGGALLAGWSKRRLAGPFAVVEPAPVKPPAGARRYDTAEALPKSLSPAAIVFAVKPQALPDILPAYRRFAAGGTVFLSIAAGKTLGFF